MFFKSKAAEGAPRAKRAPGPALGADGELDARALGRAVWRRKRALVLPTLIVAVLAAIAVNVLTPFYKSESRILFDGRENIFLRPEAEKANAEKAAAAVADLTTQVPPVLSPA